MNRCGLGKQVWYPRERGNKERADQRDDDRRVYAICDGYRQDQVSLGRAGHKLRVTPADRRDRMKSPH
jgi:hypothetical protein